MSAINREAKSVYNTAIIVCKSNPNAKYLILSRLAFELLLSHAEVFNLVIINGVNNYEFMGKQIAFIEDNKNIIIDIGGL